MGGVHREHDGTAAAERLMRLELVRGPSRRALMTVLSPLDRGRR